MTRQQSADRTCDLMIQTVTAHLIHQLNNAAIQSMPFPHFYMENVFPDDFYAELQENMPAFPAYEPISKVRNIRSPDGKPAFNDRFVISFSDGKTEISPFWQGVRSVLFGQEFGSALLAKFGPALRQRTNGESELGQDLVLIRDRQNYDLGPHTDHPNRLVVFLVYLANPDDNPDLGTSLYVPKDRDFVCDGGPHWPREKFDRVFTAPYRPNSALGFLKTNNSFHGVEPVPNDAERNLMQFYLGLTNG